MTVTRVHDRYTDGTHGVSAFLSVHQLRTLLNEADGEWAEFYRGVLKLRAAERKPCTTGSHVVAARCSCPAFEATLEAGA